MKKFTLVLLMVFTNYCQVLAQAGKLDFSFGTKGMVTSASPGNTSPDRGTKTLVLPDGKIIAAGYVNNGSFLYKISDKGIPDPDFGVNGISAVIPNMVVSDALIQKDGKIIITGTPNEDGYGAVTLARFNSDGSRDTSFGVNGVATRPSSGYESQQPYMALQNDGKILILKLARDENNPNGAAGVDFLLIRFNADGSIDNSFGNNGSILTDINNSDESNARILVQPDDKIIITGTTSSCPYGCYGGVVTRYDANGLLDESFSEDGKLVLDLGNDFNSILAAFLLDGDKLILAGTSGNYSVGVNFILAHINSDGTLDNSFDSDGIKLTPINQLYIFIKSVARQSDGKFVAAGGFIDINTSTYDSFFSRFNDDGTIDNTFDNDGMVAYDMSSYDSYDEWELLRSVSIQEDNKIVAIGYANITVPNEDFALARLNADGSLDTDFDGDGKLYLAYGQSETYFLSMTKQTDGKTLAAGSSKFSGGYGNYNFAVARFTIDGTADSSFGTDGIKSISFYDQLSCSASEINVLSDDKIVIAGTTSTSNFTTEIAIAKLNQDGSFDDSFDGDGKLTLDLGGNSYSYTAFKILPDGKILVAGTITEYSTTTTRNVFLARLTSDGTLDQSFNGTGITVVDLNPDPSINSDNDVIVDIIVQADKKILAVGRTSGPMGYYDLDMTVLRFNKNGTLDTGFDQDGKLIIHVSDNYDQASTAAVQTDGKIIVGGSSSTNTATYFALVRINSDGSLDLSFDGDGKLTTDMGPYWTDMINSVSIQDDDKIIASGYSEVVNNGVTGAGIARYNSNGSIDTGFGDNGKILIPDSELNSAAIFDNKLYFCGSLSEGVKKGLIERYTLAEIPVSVKEQSISSAPVLKAWPNPSSHDFSLSLKSLGMEPVEVKVYDTYGRVVYATKRAYNSDYIFGGKFNAGVYIAEVRQGNKRLTIKLIKQ